jgi:Zn-dependent alcohol dehydrogenase
MSDLLAILLSSRSMMLSPRGFRIKLLDIAPIEAPGPGQAAVRVVTAGANILDVDRRRGTYPRQVPFTLGRGRRGRR